MDVITFARDRSTSISSFQNSTKSTSHLQTNLNKISNIQTSSLSVGMSSCGVPNMAGVPMKHLLALTKKKEVNKKSPNRVSKSKCLKENHHYVKCEKRSLLQIPDSPKDPKILKSNVSRGSWPGPGVDNSGSVLDSSFSKSEQHLNVLGGDVCENNHRKLSDCSSDGHYLNMDSINHSSIGSSEIDKSRKYLSDRDPMSSKLFQ